MVSKCANPNCAASFLYFHVGKLFRVDTSAGSDRRRSLGQDEFTDRRLRRVEFYWLCESCAPKMTLVFDKHTGAVQPRVHAKSAAA